MICCGKQHDTPYCPQCGKALRQANPLEELLAHCRDNERRTLNELRRMEREPASETHYIEIKKRTLNKWTRWCDALAEAAAKAQGSTAQ